MGHNLQNQGVEALKQEVGKQNTKQDLGGDAVGHSVLALIDSRSLTRESFSSLFRDLSSEFSVVCFSSPHDLPGLQGQINGSNLVLVLNIGALSTDDESVRENISLIRCDFEHEPIILLGDLTTAGHVLEAFHLGVQGYLPTTLSATVALEALRLVRSGGTYVPFSAVAEALESLYPSVPEEGAAKQPASEDHKSPSDQPCFTVRQSQVLDFLRKGASNKLIAHELNMKESTVKVHVRHIMKKCHASNRTQAALFAEKIV